MIARWGLVRGVLAAALIVGPFAGTEADAKGGRGGHGGGGHAHAPRVSSAHRSAKPPAYKPPKMPHAPATAHRNAAKTGGQAQHPANNHANVNAAAHRANTAVNHTNTAVAHANAVTANRGNVGGKPAGVANRANAAGVNRGTASGVNPTVATAAASSTHNAAVNPFGYTYGTGSGARRYHAYGYGRGYRNRYYGGRYGYGRSQGQNRAIVGRLRSIHSSLARIDHDYQGHRVRAMHQVSMAIRQLSHRSMGYGGMGYGSGMNRGMGMGVGMNNGRGMGMNNGMGMGQGGLGRGGRRGQPMSQQQSDARMSQSLRNLQGVNMQLTSQGSNSSGHSRPRGHVMMAMRDLNMALSIR